MGHPHDLRNGRSRQRLSELVDSLRPQDYEIEAEGGWTVGALLAHIAFWDSFVAGRWEHAHSLRRLTPVALADETSDLVNAAAIPMWRLLPATRVSELVVRSAAEVDGAIELLSDAALGAIAREGRQGLIDRSVHRAEHTEAIERALAARTAPV